jgi:hypothetical protein
MYEHRRQPLSPRPVFYARLARNTAVAFCILVVSLGLGMAGYRYTEHLDWLDAFANASMILSGMGPLAPLQTKAGKLFAGCYALFSGLAFVTSMGIIFAPVFHRFIHRFHLEADEEKTPRLKG